MTRLSRAGGFALLLVAACRPSPSTTPAPLPAPTTTPPVVKPTPAAAPALSAPAPHSFAWGAGTYRYVIQSDAIIAAEGAPRVDTISTRAVVTYRVTAGDSGLRAIEGSVDSFTVTRTGVATPLSAGLPFTLTTAADGAPHGAPVADSAGVCTTPLQAVVATSRELIVAIPVALAPDAEWTDSLVTVSCRGTLPLTMRSERHSRAAWTAVPADWARHDGDAAFEITRTIHTTIVGQGRAAGRDIAVTGTGEGNGVLYVDPEVGTLLGGVTNSSTRLTVDSGTQRQQFLQTVRQRVTLQR